jgi:phosphatidylglycerol lysyltransferase
LQECSLLLDEWRITRASPLWSASQEWQCPLAIVRCRGEIVAFGPIWQGAAKSEMTIEPVCCAPTAPAETLAFLLTEAMLWARAAGFYQFNLGLGQRAGENSGPLAPLWEQVGATALRYGEHFQTVEQARAFLRQFDPLWLPRFMAAPAGWKLPRVLTDLAGQLRADKQVIEKVEA